MEESRWIPVGKIVRAHGIRGDVKIYPYGETLATKKAGDRLYISSFQAEERSRLTIVSLRPHGKYWVGRFQELADRDEVEKIIGEEIFLTEDLLPPTSEGEYYYYQLIGLSVETKTGSKIGILRRIFEAPSHDIYVVEGEGREVLIPAVEEVICHIDLEEGRMVVDLPEGLMDAL